MTFEMNQPIINKSFLKFILNCMCIWFFSFSGFAQNSNSSDNDTTFVNITSISKDFVLDMKYATNQNFLKTKVYPCEACYLREKTVKALNEANIDFQKKGFRIKIFDCYRPLDVQKKMWTIVSNPIYVANPAKGSIHNRGGAVDITLVDDKGNELPMGTEFDHFGPEAAHDFKEFPSEIRHNRKLLKRIMKRNGFESFDSEWWHYNLKGARKEKLSNFTWNCN